MALTTLQELKTYLGITSTSEDDRLNAFIAQATAVINNFCVRRLEDANYTEYYEGNNRREFALKQYPVNSITSIHLDSDGYYGHGDNAFSSDDLLVLGTDYTYNSVTGIVYKLSGSWPAVRVAYDQATQVGQFEHGLGNIKVIYNAGYTTIPDDLKYAANNFIAMMRRTAGTGGTFQSESFDYYSYSLPSTAEDEKIIGSIRNILSKYRKHLLF